MSLPLHAIGAVVRQTGLSAHVIRVWERRYGAVKPHRTSTQRRMYADSEVERLILLRQLTHAGQSISSIATFPTAKLKKLLDALPGSAAQASPSPPTTESSEVLLENCMAAIRGFDARALEQTLKKAELTLGSLGVLLRVVAPLAQSIGTLWREGAITAAHEHFASVVLKNHLVNAAKAFAAGEDQPGLVVTTPAGQLHELGALLVGAVAANLGWKVTYLGVSLPAAEIAGAVIQSRARALALSIVYPEDDQKLNRELLRLRELLPPHVVVITGGRAAHAYRETLVEVGAIQANDLTELGSLLDRLRTRPPPSASGAALTH